MILFGLLDCRVNRPVAEQGTRHWIQMLITSLDCGDQGMNLQTRRRQSQHDVVERRADRAEVLVCMGEFSAGRQAPEGVPVAPGNDRILRELCN